jgi:small subunit ribosomal protein S2
LAIVTMKELLEAGVHFGHQTRRWDPHMKQYIFTERNGIHIIDLQRTIAHLKIAYNAIKAMAKQNGIILFVGTKKQAQSAITENANRCNMPYVATRWLGGMITNFVTIRNSINRLNRIERMEVDGSFDFMTKKEGINLRRERDKLLRNIGGIKDMETLPDMIFVIDPKKEAIAVAEALRAKIPLVAIVDTNCNPEGIDYPIPGNDDAIRAINLFASIVSSAVIEGQNEAGKFEITEETKIISLEEEEAKAEALEEGYISEEEYLSDEIQVNDDAGKPLAADEQVKDEAPAEQELKDRTVSKPVSPEEPAAEEKEAVAAEAGEKEPAVREQEAVEAEAAEKVPADEEKEAVAAEAGEKEQAVGEQEAVEAEAAEKVPADEEKEAVAAEAGEKEQAVGEQEAVEAEAGEQQPAAEEEVAADAESDVRGQAVEEEAVVADAGAQDSETGEKQGDASLKNAKKKAPKEEEAARKEE